MAKISYSTGITKTDKIVCAAPISCEVKYAEVGKKFCKVQSFGSRELSL